MTGMKDPLALEWVSVPPLPLFPSDFFPTGPVLQMMDLRRVEMAPLPGENQLLRVIFLRNWPPLQLSHLFIPYGPPFRDSSSAASAVVRENVPSL